MTYIPAKAKNNRTVGSLVFISEPIEVLSGTFTAGHIFKVTGSSARGLDLIDCDGNILSETLFSDSRIYSIDMYDEIMFSKDH